MKPYINARSPQYFAFNIWDISSAKAVMDGAAQAGRAIILQTSMKAFMELDRRELRSFVTSYGKKRRVPAFLHLDHCRDVKAIEEAIGCGWDSVMIDASDKPLEENIGLTNQVYRMAEAHNVLVEAEIGQIPKTSHDIIEDGSGAARIEDVETFVKYGHMDILAAAVGTCHGLYQGLPKLRYNLIEDIGELTDIPLAIHGGSGLTDEMFLRLLSYRNVKKINISTDVKQAYRRGLTESMERGYMVKDNFDPLKVERQVHDLIEAMAVQKLRLLGIE